MNNKLKTILLVAAFVLFIVIAAFAYNKLGDSYEMENIITVESEAGDISSEEEKTEEKTKALDFTVEDFEGEAVKLSEKFGKPIVLNFWASWCPPCKSEMPDFDNVYKELGEEIEFVMVNLTDGQKETKEKGNAYIEEQGFTFPVYYDVNSEAAYIYGVTSVPMTIFIDKDGFLTAGARGAIDEETLRKGIELITE